MKGASKEAKAKKAPKKPVPVQEEQPVATASYPVIIQQLSVEEIEQIRQEQEKREYLERVERAKAEIAEQHRLAEEQTKQSIAAAGEDLMKTFDKAWSKFKDFVSMNAVHLNNPEQAEMLCRAVNKPSELALITLAMKLPEHAHMIVQRDGVAARRFAMSLVDVSRMVLPEPVEQKAFDFFTAFLAILETIQQK